MKKLLILLTTLAFSAIAIAADNAAIEAQFQKYWDAYAKKDFTKAGAEIFPADLEELKTEVLPVFVSAQSHPKKQAQEIVNLFFGKAVGKARESMSPSEVFAGFCRVITGNNPDYFDLLKEAKTSIVFVRTPDNDNAEVHFQITFRGESDMNAERLIKKNGRWWMRITEDPKEVAAQFKQAFAADR